MVRSAFRQAAAQAPCVVFLDEIDVVAPNRAAAGQGGASDVTSGVQSRVLSTLLNELDGVEGRGGVYVIATSRKKSNVDAALLRPGRLDEIVHLDLPDDETVLEILTRAWSSREGVTITLAADLDVTSLAHYMVARGWGCADVVARARAALLYAVKEHLRKEARKAARKDRGDGDGDGDVEAAQSEGVGRGMQIELAMKHVDRAIRDRGSANAGKTKVTRGKDDSGEEGNGDKECDADREAGVEEDSDPESDQATR